MARSKLPLKIVDNDKDEITAVFNGGEVRGWSYSSEAERRQKMLQAHEFAEGWFQAGFHPDLLAALKALLHAPCLAQDRDSYRACKGSQESVQHALAVIAKAEGK